MALAPALGLTLIVSLYWFSSFLFVYFICGHMLQKFTSVSGYGLHLLGAGDSSAPDNPNETCFLSLLKASSLSWVLWRTLTCIRV